MEEVKSFLLFIHSFIQDAVLQQKINIAVALTTERRIWPQRIWKRYEMWKCCMTHKIIVRSSLSFEKVTQRSHMLSIPIRLKSKSFQVCNKVQHVSYFLFPLQVSVQKTGLAASHALAPLAWNSSGTAWADHDTDICLSSLLITVSLECESAACVQMRVAHKLSQHEAMRNVTPWVGVRCLCTPTRVTGITAAGRGDLRQDRRLLSLIRSIVPVCKGFSGRIDDHPSTRPPWSPLVLLALC